MVRSTALMTSSREQFGRLQDLNFADLDKTPVECWTHLPHELANLRWILACQPTISGSSSTCCESAWSAIFFLPLFSFRSASYQTKVTKYCQKDIERSISLPQREYSVAGAPKMKMRKERNVFPTKRGTSIEHLFMVFDWHWITLKIKILNHIIILLEI